MPINTEHSKHPPIHTVSLASDPLPPPSLSHTTSYAAVSITTYDRRSLAQTTISGMAAASFSARGGAAALAMALVVAVLSSSPPTARADFAQDRAMCADKLMGLATCLTFVQEKASARAPTPDCCAGLKQVVAASKTCMCVLVKDRDEPALGFRINVTRAMDLPDLCNSPATFSDCPKILGMSPDAPEAEIFKEYAQKHEGKNATIPAAATGAGKSTSAAPTAAGARRQPCAVFFYLVSALLVSVAVLLA